MKENNGIIVLGVIVLAAILLNGIKFSSLGGAGYCTAQGTFTDLGGGMYKMTIDNYDHNSLACTPASCTQAGCNLALTNIFSQTNNPSPNAVCIGNTGLCAKSDPSMQTLSNADFVLVSNDMSYTVPYTGAKEKNPIISRLSWEGQYYTMAIAGYIPTTSGSVTYKDMNYQSPVTPPVVNPPTTPPVVNPPTTPPQTNTTPPVTPPVTPPITDTSTLSVVWLIIFAGIAVGVIYLWRR